MITRWVDQADLYTLPERIAAGTFYVLETNYDHWKKPLFLDDRRDAAMKCMNATGSANIATDTLFGACACALCCVEYWRHCVVMRACMRVHVIASERARCVVSCCGGVR